MQKCERCIEKTQNNKHNELQQIQHYKPGKDMFKLSNKEILLFILQNINR